MTRLPGPTDVLFPSPDVVAEVERRKAAVRAEGESNPDRVGADRLGADLVADALPAGPRTYHFTGGGPLMQWDYERELEA
ncbi:MAG TPA: hypothetical protein VM487_14220 [Phycisphaerae bacterium]|nr:hypothetical protein [Phycisphaerae bacterium]HUU96890.1 hypothetical protein [Phycisphaerae bacterium]